MFLSISFGIINAILILYLKGPMHLDQHHQYALSTAYNAMLFILPLIGGYTAGQLGYKKALMIATALCFLGPLALFNPDKTSLIIGLSLFATGTGFYVPTYLVLVGKLYTRDDNRRESGYTIVYVLSNLGFLLSAFIASYVQRYEGFNDAFVLGSLFMFIVAASFPFLLWRIKNYDNSPIEANSARSETTKWIILILTVLCTVPLCYSLLDHAALTNKLLIALVALEGLGLLVLALKQKNHIDKMRLFAFMLLAFLSMGFFALYILEPSLLTIFIQTNVDRNVFGYNIPAALSYGLNPFYILIMGSLLAYMWVRLRHIGRDPSLPAKFTLSLVFMCIGMLVYTGAIWFSGFDSKVALAWPVIGYFFLTCAELFITPIGFAMVGRLAPEGMEGGLMGVWQTFTGLSAAIADYFAEQATIPKGATLTQSNHIYFVSFGKFALIAIVLGMASWVLLPFIKRAIGHPKRAN